MPRTKMTEKEKQASKIRNVAKWIDKATDSDVKDMLALLADESIVFISEQIGKVSEMKKQAIIEEKKAMLKQLEMELKELTAKK